MIQNYMIIKRDTFDLNNKSVIEKLIITAPFKYTAVFPNEACFIFFKQGHSVFNSPSERLFIGINESILLRCGNYFADLIQSVSDDVCEIYAIHLYPDIIKEIYGNEIPSFIRSKQAKRFAQKLSNQSIINQFFDSLIFYFENPSIVSPEIVRLKIKELILLLLQTKNAETIIELISFLFTPRKATLHEVIHTHLFSNLSLNELAVFSGMSLSLFKREFQKTCLEHLGTSSSGILRQAGQS